MREVLVTPATGTLIELTAIADEVFSQKMLGDGFGLLTNESDLLSPAVGEVTMIYDTGHAIGIKTSYGHEILIHIGIDTVDLAGVPFDAKVKIGEKVDHRSILTTVDWQLIKDKNYDPTIIVVALNESVDHLVEQGEVTSGTAVAELKD